MATGIDITRALRQAVSFIEQYGEKLVEFLLFKSFAMLLQKSSNFDNDPVTTFIQKAF